MENSFHNSYSITPAMIQAWREQLARLDVEIKKKQQEIKILQQDKSKLHDLIQAGLALCPNLKSAAQNTNAPMLLEKKEPIDINKRGAWTGLINEIIAESKKGITYANLKNAVKETKFAFKIKENENAVYSAVEKLAYQKKVVKYHGRLFSPFEYGEYKKAIEKGIIKEDVRLTFNGRQSPASEMIMAFLNRNPKGSDSKGIAKEMKKYPELRESIKHSSFIYNVLASLKKKNLIEKEGSLYRAVFLTNAAAGTDTPAAASGGDASHHRSVPASINEML